MDMRTNGARNLRLGITAVVLLFTSASLAQNPPATPPPDTTQSPPAAEGKDIGGYHVTQSIEIGGRISEVNGSQAMYDTLVNYQTGARILEQSLTMQSLSHQDIFDTLTVSSFGWGGDPEQAARMRKGSYTEYPVCGTGTWGAEFYGNIRPAEHDVVVTKHRFNAFHNTDLDTILRANGIRSLVFSGCVSNVCVESTARDAFMRDYYVIVTSDGTAAYTAESHNATLSNIDKYFGEVSTIADVCAIWQRCTKSAQGIARR